MNTEQNYMQNCYSPTTVLLRSFLENPIGILSKENGKYILKEKHEYVFIPELNSIGTHSRNKISRDYQSSTILVSGEYYRVLSESEVFLSSSFKDMFISIKEKCNSLPEIREIDTLLRPVEKLDTKYKYQFTVNKTVSVKNLEDYIKILEFWKMQKQELRNLQLIVVRYDQHLLLNLH